MVFEYYGNESHVTTYNKFRPCPPRSLINRIVEYASEKLPNLAIAVDVGCGSGQSTEVLAPYFKEVLGLDPSPPIIAEARKKCERPNVKFSVSTAEKINLKDHSIHVVTTCQAIHWFNISQFYAEVERILCTNGVLAIYGYHLPVLVYKDREGQLSAIVRKYYTEILGDYVLSESKMVYLDNYSSTKYNDVPFVIGGKMLREENFTTETEAGITDIVGYVASWSAYQNYVKHLGNEEGMKILSNFEAELKTILGDITTTGDKLKIKFNYFLLIGRKE